MKLRTGTALATASRYPVRIIFIIRTANADAAADVGAWLAMTWAQGGGVNESNEEAAAVCKAAPLKNFMNFLSLHIFVMKAPGLPVLSLTLC